MSDRIREIEKDVAGWLSDDWFRSRPPAAADIRYLIGIAKAAEDTERTLAFFEGDWDEHGTAEHRARAIRRTLRNALNEKDESEG